MVVICRKEDALASAINGGVCDFSRIRNSPKRSPLTDSVRPKAWQVLLGVFNKHDPFANWDYLYDLPEQNDIRQQCHEIVGML